ncbi:Telomerase holoenzyme est3 subunit [Lasiodiplodia theobromae]|uniref:Telomerase holoenzyme est3 subunit n=1 Tax=Lasiodiplodia theobromae TaxID=45133 RepID=UPI0015C40D2A|nr:Telomerase holoenzyme est3 subunit [Lasiodiplodia theobromae]KAF4541799.1 Telomerase holoenzyme est3 subunit [Lasiodiplodia theobromae]
MNETMLPSALPKKASQHADSSPSQSKSQIPKTNPRQDVAEEEHEEEDVVVMHTEEDASGLTGLDEEINGTANSGESRDPVEQPNPDKGDAPRDPKVSAEGQVSKGPAANNNTPTSYQIPVQD